jgi:hypothetical protein
LTYKAQPARSLLNRQKCVTTAHPRSGDPRPMTPPATAVASDFQSQGRPAPRTRIARRRAPAGLTQGASASRTTSTHPEASPVEYFQLPYKWPITSDWQVPL